MGYEKRQFLYGMDFDTEERLIEQGYSRKNVNVRIGASTDDGVFSAENVQGNTLIPNLELPDGENKVIGSFWYQLKNLNYYFVWNSKGEHGIFEYNHVSSLITRVMIAKVLNFSKDYLITGINVVEFDDTNDLLYWSEKSNPPRKINIQKAKSDGYNLPISEEVIDAIKYPPLCQPTASFETDTNRKTNYLIDIIWQFKARYGYDDKEKSAFSPISSQVFPNSSCLSDAQGNTIRIIIPKGGELVTRVEIAARKGNINDFEQVIDLEVGEYELDSNGNYIYLFTNDKALKGISVPESIKLYDNVPQIAGAQEFIANRLMYADVTEGYDNVDVDYELGVSYDTVDEKKPLNTITGALRIINSSGDFQPIHNTGNGVMYGGFDITKNANNTFAGTSNVIDGLSQGLPLKGFVIYLAGTTHHTISLQSYGNNEEFQSSDKYHTYDSSGNKGKKAVKSEMDGKGGAPWTKSRLKSTFKIENVPDGEYILRVASNLTTAADLADKNLGYQKTSTTVLRIDTSFNYSRDQKPTKEHKVVVKGGEIKSGIFITISDLTAHDSSSYRSFSQGYVVNSSKTDYSPTSISDLLSQARVDSANLISISGGNLYTDHNGFVFGTAFSILHSGEFSDSNLLPYRLSDSASNPSTITLYSGYRSVFLSRSSNIYNYSKTEAIVKVSDSSGLGVEGVSVVTERGETKFTDENGNAKITFYANTLIGGVFGRKLKIFAYTFGSCDVTLFPFFKSKDVLIGEDYNNTLTAEEEPVDLGVINAVFATDSGFSGLKPGGVYRYGVVYYDKANRSGLTNVITNPELSIPFYTELDNPNITSASGTWEIKNRPPEWATHYQWVRTKDTAIDSYLQWYTDAVQYTESDTLIEIDITNLTDEYVNSNPSSNLSYGYKEGDRLRFIKDSAGEYFEEYIDLKVVKFEEGKITVENLATAPNINDGLLFEVYHPRLDVDEDLYYEVGECYKVLVFTRAGTDYRYHEGQDKNQDAIFIDRGATGTFKTGDTYFRSRSIPVSTLINANYNSLIDSQSFSDFWLSDVSDIGRVNIVDLDAKRVTRPTTIYYSERFIPETNINGLNSFYDVSFETYDRNFGAIKKLFSFNNRLDCFQELRVSKILVEENVIYDQFDKGTVAASAKVLSKEIYYQGEYGTSNPESFVSNEGRRYFFDIRNGKVLRLSTDGLTPISDNKMHSYFESKSNFYSAFNIIPEVWGTYDENFEEYIINFGVVSRDEGFTPDDLELVGSQAEVITETIDGTVYTFVIEYGENDQGVNTEFTIVEDVANGVYVINSNAGDITLDRQKILAIPSETLGFSEKTKHWTSFYTYLPECMGRVGIDFLTFKNGNAYLHNTHKERNTFYGLGSSSEVWAVFNQDPSNNKVYQSLSEESDTVWEAREILTQKGQKSNLIKEDFAVDYGQGHTLYSRENIHSAAVLKDENTPNVDTPLIEGDSMRDVSILFKLINESTDKERLFASSVRYSLSARTNK
tara:strand:+ start:15031 stop:19479 length:4449 start_codon:yes stop_codon:yes gene_type:complete